MKDDQIIVFKTALAPSKIAFQSLSSNCGGARFAYNHMLSWSKTQYELSKKGLAEKPGLSMYALRKQWNIEKQSVATDWWLENDSQAYASALDGLANAYKNFFARTEVGYPKFKKRGDKDSYATDRVQLTNSGRTVRLAKMGNVRLHERLKSADWLLRCGASLQLATINIDAIGRVFIVLRLKVPAALALEFLRGKFSRKGSGFIGVDVGLKEFLTVSDGQVVSNPRFLRNLEDKLARAQQNHARKIKDSKSSERARLKVARIHKKIANQRSDFHWKTARDLVQFNTGIAVESLSVKNMLKNHCLAKSISDAAWSSFFAKLKYLGGRYGTQILEANRWFASSKTCSSCGEVKAKLSLKERVYNCEKCGLSADRDWNAAENLRSWGIDALRYSESLNGGDSLQTTGSRQQVGNLGQSKSARRSTLPKVASATRNRAITKNPAAIDIS